MNKQNLSWPVSVVVLPSHIPWVRHPRDRCEHPCLRAAPGPGAGVGKNHPRWTRCRPLHACSPQVVQPPSPAAPSTPYHVSLCFFIKERRSVKAFILLFIHLRVYRLSSPGSENREPSVFFKGNFCLEQRPAPGVGMGAQ